MTGTNPHHFRTLIALLALSGITAIIAISSHGVAILLLLAMAKILLVAFRFMDLRHAHLFWKIIISVFTGATLTAVGVLAAN